MGTNANAGTTNGIVVDPTSLPVSPSGSFAGSSVEFLAGTETIIPATVTVTPAANQAIVYGTETAKGNSSLVYATDVNSAAAKPTLNGNLGGYTQFTSNVRTINTINDGNLALNTTNGDSNNYILAFAPVAYTVTPAPVTITPGMDKSVIYGTPVADALNQIGYTSSGLISGDPNLGPTSPIAGSLGLDYTANTNVGKTAIHLGTLRSSNPNYTVVLNLDNDSFNVVPATVTVTPVSTQIVYGTDTGTGNMSLTKAASIAVNSAAPLPTLNGTLGGYTQYTSNVTTNHTTANDITPGGLALNNTNEDSNNYTLAFAPTPVAYTVTPAPVTITPNPGVQIVLGTATPTGSAQLTYLVGPLLGNDTGTISGFLAGYDSTETAAGSPYLITGLGSVGSSNPNYAPVLADGSFTFQVVPRAVPDTPAALALRATTQPTIIATVNQVAAQTSNQFSIQSLTAFDGFAEITVNQANPSTGSAPIPDSFPDEKLVPGSDSKISTIVMNSIGMQDPVSGQNSTLDSGSGVPDSINIGELSNLGIKREKMKNDNSKISSEKLGSTLKKIEEGK